MKLISVLTLCAALCATQAHAQTSAGASANAADDGSKLLLQFSPYTYHYSYSPEHKPVVLVGLEQEAKDQSLRGLALFRNSFGQPSVYLYPWGHAYRDVWGVQGLGFKWSAGLLYGYKPPYNNKVPLNYKGFSPGAIPSVFYEMNPRTAFQVDILGNSALTFSLTYKLK